MFVVKKARTPVQTLNDLDAYISGLGDEPIEFLAREVRGWGEFSYSELEAAIAAGRLDELIAWRERYARVVNEVLAPMWASAFLIAAERATRGKTILSDSDPDVRNWLTNHGGELISRLSDESRRAIANVILHAQERLMNPKQIARQIRPLIGLNAQQAQANFNYRLKVYNRYMEGGASIEVATSRAEKAALRYAGKQHRFRAETITHTELAFAYNQGAHVGVQRAISRGLMSRCAMVWTTAGTNRVCPRCLPLKGKIVGYTDEEGVQIPPLHPRCRCAIDYREVGDTAGNIEMPRRRQAQDGHEIIDKPTYQKLTNWFIKSGGVIIRGEEAARHLANSGASASYVAGANAAFITDTASVSDVLEEMYHARQDRRKMFGELTQDLVWLRREIDAQKYLMRVADKYKIPESERRVTRVNLAHYEKQLEDILNGK